MIHLYAAAIDHIEDLEERIKELEALLGEVWAKTESYRARMDYHLMLRGESKRAYEELKVRVEKALGQDRARCIVPLQNNDDQLKAGL